MRLRLALAGLIAAVLCGALAWEEPLNNYDTAFALAWGRDLIGGTLPDYELALAPTPHPLANLFAMALALPGEGYAPHYEGAMWLWQAAGYVALLVLGLLTFALGRAWFGIGAGALAAVIVLTREPVLSFGLRAYVDIPYLCLLLGALLVETRSPRAGRPVLVLLMFAGLLRPEAWLFALAYAWWLRRGGVLRAGHVALAVAAPLLWALSDLLITGDPLHSLTGTRANAEELGRVTGLDDVPLTMPRRLGEILREPVLLGAAGGGLLALWRLRSRASLGAAAGLLAIAAFCMLALAGLPIITRYLLGPAVILAIFCGAGVFGWLALEREDPWRTGWMAFGALVVVALVAFAPAQRDRLERLDGSLARQAAILDELAGYFTQPIMVVEPRGCGPLTLPNRRAVPQVALWAGVRAGDVRVAQEDGVGNEGTYFAPSSPQAARDFVLDRRDRNRRLPAPPRGAGVDVIRGEFWTVHRRCRDARGGATARRGLTGRQPLQATARALGWTVHPLSRSDAPDATPAGSSGPG